MAGQASVKTHTMRLHIHTHTHTYEYVCGHPNSRQSSGNVLLNRFEIGFQFLNASRWFGGQNFCRHLLCVGVKALRASEPDTPIAPLPRESRCCVRVCRSDVLYMIPPRVAFFPCSDLYGVVCSARGRLAGLWSQPIIQVRR